MSKIAVIGAGDVGSSIAYTAQLTGLATEIVLVDSHHARAEGHVLDMNHGLAFTAPVRIARGEYADCAGADMVVVTAGARQKEGETRLDLTRRNAAIIKGIMHGLGPYLGDAKVLVITNPVEVMTKAAIESSGRPFNRVFGAGTVLDSARFRYELSHRCRVDARNVHAYVIGEHGDSEVFLWSQVRIAGIELKWFCPQCGRNCTMADREAIEKVVTGSAYHVIESKGYTNYGVSLAVRRIMAAVLRNESSVLTVSALLAGEYGLDGMCLSVPCILNADGIGRIVEARLAEVEREGLRRSAAIVAEAGCDLFG